MSTVRQRKAYALAVILLVLAMAPRALAQTPVYPVPTTSPTAQVEGGIIERPTEVKGVRISADTEETLPITGSDLVGMALVAGLLISMGTMFSLRARSPAREIQRSDTRSTPTDRE